MLLSPSGMKKPSAGGRAARAEQQLLDVSSVVAYQIDYVGHSIYDTVAIGIGSAVKWINRVSRPAVAGVRQRRAESVQAYQERYIREVDQSVAISITGRKFAATDSYIKLAGIGGIAGIDADDCDRVNSPVRHQAEVAFDHITAGNIDGDNIIIRVRKLDAGQTDFFDIAYNHRGIVNADYRRRGVNYSRNLGRAGGYQAAIINDRQYNLVYAFNRNKTKSFAFQSTNVDLNGN